MTEAIKSNASSLWQELKSLQPYYWLVFLGCWVGGVFDGMDSNLFPVMLPNILKELLHTTDKSQISQAGSQVTFLFLIGWTLGGIVMGLIGDKLGRVRSMVISILLYSIFTGLSGLAQDVPQLALCRFLTGIGIGGELVSISTMLSEIWPNRSRAIAVGALITSYQGGVLLSGIVTQVVTDWRQAFFVGAIPALLALLLRLKLNEPEKWIEEKQRQKTQNVKTAPLKEIFALPHIKNTIVGSLVFCGLLIGYWASLVWIPTWIQDLLGANHTGSEKSIATVYHSLGGILGCFSAGFLAVKFGRKPTILFGSIGGFFTSAWLFFSNTQFSEMIYWQDAVLGYFISVLQAIIYIYLPELFPTRIRATAVGFCLNAGRVAAAFASLNVGTFVLCFGGYAQAAFVFSFSYLLAALVLIIAQETKGQELPD